MTRNQKIALGCGGAGCLGLIVAVIVGCVVYFMVMRQPAYRASREYNFNVNLNQNSDNSNSSTSNSNENSNTNSNTSNSNSDSSTSASSMSNDDKHKLFQAAGVTHDTELINRVNVKIGILNEDFTPGQEYDRFIGEHVTWAIQHTEFIMSINTPDKARAYVNAHFPE